MATAIEHPTCTQHLAVTLDLEDALVEVDGEGVLVGVGENGALGVVHVNNGLQSYVLRRVHCGRWQGVRRGAFAIQVQTVTCCCLRLT